MRKKNNNKWVQKLCLEVQNFKLFLICLDETIGSFSLVQGEWALWVFCWLFIIYCKSRNTIQVQYVSCILTNKILSKELDLCLDSRFYCLDLISHIDLMNHPSNLAILNKIWCWILRSIYSRSHIQCFIYLYASYTCTIRKTCPSNWSMCLCVWCMCILVRLTL